MIASLATESMTDDQRWAKQMAEQESRGLFHHMLLVQSRCEGILEFSPEAGGLVLEPDEKAEVAKTVELLQEVYMKCSGARS